MNARAKARAGTVARGSVVLAGVVRLALRGPARPSQPATPLQRTARPAS